MNDQPPQELSLYAKLKDRSLETTSDAYEIGLKRLATEESLGSRIDTKATGLFGVVGFAMTLAFSFGGWPLLDNVRKVPLGWVIAVAFVLTLIVGLYTAARTLWVLRVRVIKVIDEKEVLDDEALAMKDRQAYRRWLAAHVWYVVEENYAVNMEKARDLSHAQKAFGAFLCGILALSGLAAISSIVRGPDPTPPAPTLVCPSPTPSAFVTVPVPSVSVTVPVPSVSVTMPAPVAASTSTPYDAGHVKLDAAEH